MTTLLAIFLLALLLSLLLTPLAERLGVALGALDMPGGRRVHDRVTPRTGGLAVFFALLLTLGVTRLLSTDVSLLLGPDQTLTWFLAGGVIVLLLGLYDDIRRLNAWSKIPLQIIAASVAYLGGIALDRFALFGMAVFFDPITSYFLTVFWFLLFMNALNLMDGLDGLAGGIVFFASLVMVVLSIPREDYLTAMFFAALAGSVLGFLRYNFHPATIFLGDAGTYFLGYAIAGFGLITSVKSQVGAAILIPVLAMGLPLLDTLLAALRRFIQGRRIFQPDSDHIHHRLLKMGLNTRKAVILLYALTVLLCALAIVLVNIRDDRSGLLLVLIGAAAFIFAGRLGYLGPMRLSSISLWAQGVCEEAGLLRERRGIVHLLSELESAPDMDTLQNRLGQILEIMGFAEFRLQMHKDWDSTASWPDCRGSAPDRDKGSPELHRLCLQIPLFGSNHKYLGMLTLSRVMQNEQLGSHTLGRVELLRRSLQAGLSTLADSTKPVNGPDTP